MPVTGPVEGRVNYVFVLLCNFPGFNSQEIYSTTHRVDEVCSITSKAKVKLGRPESLMVKDMDTRSGWRYPTVGISQAWFRSQFYHSLLCISLHFFVSKM